MARGRMALNRLRVEEFLLGRWMRWTLGFLLALTMLCSIIVDQSVISLHRTPLVEKGALNKGNIRLTLESHALKEVIHVAIVSCGLNSNRREEVNVLLKSCVMFTFHKVHIHIFAPDDTKHIINTFLLTWPESFRRRLIVYFYEPFFPADAWKNLFRPCSSERLFMPFKLPNSVKKVIYFDIDVVVVTPLEDIWAEFDKFGPNTQVAMALNNVIYDGWYDQHTEIRRPKKYPHGFNSGVLLMHVARIRNDSQWISNLNHIAAEQQFINILGDQDILNHYLSLFPDRGHLLPCTMNYRTDFCRIVNDSNIQGCPGAEDTGALIIHGNRFVFHHQNKNAFRHIFNTFLKYNFSENLEQHFLPEIKKMQNHKDWCVYLHPILYKRIEDYVHLVNGDIMAAPHFPPKIYGPFVVKMLRELLKKMDDDNSSSKHSIITEKETTNSSLAVLRVDGRYVIGQTQGKKNVTRTSSNSTASSAKDEFILNK